MANAVRWAAIILIGAGLSVFDLEHSYSQSTETVILNFDSVDASGGSVRADTYFSGYGIRFGRIQRGTRISIINSKNLAGGKVVLPSPSNVLVQEGAIGEILYTLIFDKPCESVKFTRPKILAGPSGAIYPWWAARAYTADSVMLSMASENRQVSSADINSKIFTLNGPNIKFVEFKSIIKDSPVVFPSLLVDDLTLARKISGGLSYDLASAARVSVNITRPDGWVVRQLIIDKYQQAGNYPVTWDGLDDNGQTAPEGPYQIRVLRHGGLSLRYVNSIGNSGTPPWKDAKNRAAGWGSGHGSLVAVAADATGVYAGWTGMAEGTYNILKRSPDGNRGIWGALSPLPESWFPDLQVIASDGQYLYIGCKKKLFKTRADDVFLPPGRASYRLYGMAVKPIGTDKSAGDASALTDDPASVSQSFRTGGVWGIAAGNSRVYVSIPWKNLVEVYRADNLETVPAENISITRPRGLALDGEGNILVVSERKVHRVNLESKAASTFIDHDLEGPFAIARSSSDGSIYVTDVTAHQIKKFTSTGAFVRAFGRRGGGTDLTQGGIFSSADYRWPSSVAVSADGQDFWVAEDGMPKRFVMNSSADGRVKYEGFGSVNFGAAVAPNPLAPTEIFSTMWGLFSGKIDYARTFDPANVTYDNRPWKMERLFQLGWSATLPNPTKGFKLQRAGSPMAIERMFSRGGKTYVNTGAGVYGIDEKTLRPVMLLLPFLPTDPKKTMGGLSMEAYTFLRDEFVKWTPTPKPAFTWNTRAYLGASVWSDENDNASIDAEEIHFAILPGIVRNDNMIPVDFDALWMEDDFTLRGVGYDWKPASYSAAGVPVYREPGLVKASGYSPTDTAFWKSTNGATDLSVMGGRYYLTRNTPPADPTAIAFWAKRAAGHFLTSYDQNWVPRWNLKIRHAHGVANPGEAYHIYSATPASGGCIFSNDVEGWIHVIHQDGFYVQSLFDNPYPKEDRANGPNLLECDLYRSHVYQVGGKTYLYAASAQAANIYEVHGLNSVATQEPVSFTFKR